MLATAIDDHTFRSDDLEFTFAARGWSDCVSFGDMAAYRDRFERIQAYFAPRFPEAIRVGNEMIATILAKVAAEEGGGEEEGNTDLQEDEEHGEERRD